MEPMALEDSLPISISNSRNLFIASVAFFTASGTIDVFTPYLLPAYTAL